MPYAYAATTRYFKYGTTYLMDNELVSIVHTDASILFYTLGIINI